MKKTIFLIAIGSFVAMISVLLIVNLSFRLFYSSHNAETVSGLGVFAIAAAAIVLTVTKKYRVFGLGSVVGCVYGTILTLILWGA